MGLNETRRLYGGGGGGGGGEEEEEEEETRMVASKSHKRGREEEEEEEEAIFDLFRVGRSKYDLWFSLTDSLARSSISLDEMYLEKFKRSKDSK